MREILFRGKDLQEQNGWLYGYFYKSDINKRERESGKATLIFTPDCDTFIYVPEYHNSWMVKSETVGQYTGLTDKNGTRIFEGDILGCLERSEYFRYLNNVRFEVFYDRVDACFSVERYVNGNYECTRKLSTYDLSRQLEVIGNIHDNPELLKGETE